MWCVLMPCTYVTHAAQIGESNERILVLEDEARQMKEGWGGMKADLQAQVKEYLATMQVLSGSVC